MPSYTAPVEDMMFLFEKLRDNKKYNELEKYKEVSSDLVKDILEEAAKINQNLILPLAKAGDENPAVLENGVVRTPPGYKEAYKKYIEDGWTSLSCDPKYGGQGMPKTVSAFFDEMLSSASLSFKLYSELSIGAYNCINHHASDELKNKYPSYFMSKQKLQLNNDLNFEAIQEFLMNKYSSEKIDTVDGLKIDFEDSWVQLRKSNTEPIIRIYSEAKSQESADALANSVIKEITNKFM